jgi:hypothetical protein
MGTAHRNGNRIILMDLEVLRYNCFTKPVEVVITNAVVGCNNDVVYSVKNNRIVFLKSYG